MDGVQHHPESIAQACAWLATAPPRLLLALGDLWLDLHGGASESHACPRSVAEAGRPGVPPFDRLWAELDERLALTGGRTARMAATAAGCGTLIPRLREPWFRALEGQRARAIVAMAGIWTGLLALGPDEEDIETMLDQMLGPIRSVLGSSIPAAA